MDTELSIYPQELWQLHYNLDHGTEPNSNNTKIFEDLHYNMEKIEKYADDLLIKHLQEMSNLFGMDGYCEFVTNTASETAKKLYILRCYIASLQLTAKPDTIEIVTNNEKVIKCFKDSPGITIINPDITNALENSQANSEIININLRDVLPNDILSKIESVLNEYELIVTKENAWELLSDTSQKASIHDRIVGRILYLITNSTMTNKENQSGPKQIEEIINH
jgi:hypothetical protein